MVDNVSKNKCEMGDEFLTALVVFAWQALSVAFNYMSRSLLQRGKSSGGKLFGLRFQSSVWIILRDKRCIRHSLAGEGCIDYFRHSKLRWKA